MAKHKSKKLVANSPMTISERPSGKDKVTGITIRKADSGGFVVEEQHRDYEKNRTVVATNTAKIQALVKSILK